MNSDELLDIVSVDDVVVGQEFRSVIYQEKRSCFRVINAFVCNSQGELWIPRRHESKKLFPLYLDASVGGHVMSGESYEEAFFRETQEELGWKVLPQEYELVGRLTPERHQTSAFMNVYLIRSDETPDYNRKDFGEFYWLTVDGFFSKLKCGDQAKSDLPIIINEIKAKL
jgi:isopentenyldiphosphate isomerase